jgi:hypothetical protein
MRAARAGVLADSFLRPAKRTAELARPRRSSALSSSHSSHLHVGLARIEHTHTHTHTKRRTVRRPLRRRRIGEGESRLGRLAPARRPSRAPLGAARLVFMLAPDERRRRRRQHMARASQSDVGPRRSIEMRPMPSWRPKSNGDAMAASSSRRRPPPDGRRRRAALQKRAATSSPASDCCN